MTELLVGTKKGLFVLEGEPGEPFEVTRARVRRRAGRVRDARPAHRAASSRRVTSPFYGPKIFYADDAARRVGSRPQGVALPEGGDAGARADLGDRAPARTTARCTRAATPACCSSQPRRRRELGADRSAVGAPDAAGLAARAAAGCACTRSRPGRASRTGSRCALRGRRVADRRRRRDLAPRQRGPRRPLPARGRAGGRRSTLCVHDLQRAPQRPERLFMQFHGGVYRSDDAGETWTDDRRRAAVGLRLPAGRRPRRPRQRLRDPAEGRHGPRHARGPRARLRDPRRGGDAGRRAATACPREHAYLTVLRQAFDRRGEGERARALLRRHLRRRLRLARRRRDVVQRRDASPAGLLGQDRGLEVLRGSRAGAPCRVSSGTMIRRMLHSGCARSSLSASWNAAR